MAIRSGRINTRVTQRSGASSYQRFRVANQPCVAATKAHMAQYAIAIGSRYMAGSDQPMVQPLRRHLAGKSFVMLAGWLLGLPWKDTQCGFKLFTAEAAEKLAPLLRVDGFAWDVELLHLAIRMGYRVTEVPVSWEHRGHSKVSLLRDGTRMLLVLLQLRFRAR